ncbi:MAG: hypothetical protein K0S60_828 [Evtepia sp.]|nr:hypothetical protein [Evtepia sp.]
MRATIPRIKRLRCNFAVKMNMYLAAPFSFAPFMKNAIEGMVDTPYVKVRKSMIQSGQN